jgi:hypothetical protein
MFFLEAIHARTADWFQSEDKKATRMDRTHPRASTKLFYCEVDGRLVYAVAAKRLDDLTLPKEGRKDAAYVLEQRSMNIAMSEHGERRRRTYGFVNMMSDAPRVQRVRCECRYVRAGRIPHVRGSSSLEQ